jgi:hypothetical protein
MPVLRWQNIVFRKSGSLRSQFRSQSIFVAFDQIREHTLACQIKFQANLTKRFIELMALGYQAQPDPANAFEFSGRRR